MYTDEELEELEKEEEILSDEATAALLLALGVSKKDLEREIRSFYSKYGKDGVVTFQEARKWVSNKKHLRRYLLLDQVIDSVFDESFEIFSDTLSNLLRDVVLKEAEFFGVALDVDKILDTIWSSDGLSWIERLVAHQDRWRIVLNNELKKGFIKGDSVLDLLKSIDKKYEAMEKILERLCVTETTATSSLAKKEIFKKMGVEKYRFHTVPDERRCEQCGSMDGKIFPMSAYEIGVTASPLHPRCRCTAVPILD